MSSIQVFGAKDRYYADVAVPSVRSRQGSQPPAYAAAFAPVAQYLEETVSRVVSEFNVLAREALRAETGLKLNFQGRQQSVRIRVIPGLPGPLDALAQEQPDTSIWAIYLHRALFESTHDGLTTLLAEWNLLMPPAQRNLPGHEEVPNIAGRDAVQHARSIFEGLLEKAKDRRIEGQAQGLESGRPWGVLFRRGEIQIYWMAIGLLAGVIGRPVRELALITLLHELAHAYTHLGLDIDLLEWKTEEFAGADLRIAEGLAQFYTESAMDRVGSRGGELKTTFEALMGFQSEAYSCHRDWAKDLDSRGEIVRLGMVTARRHGIQKYEEFMSRLVHAGGLLERDTGSGGPIISVCLPVGSDD